MPTGKALAAGSDQDGCAGPNGEIPPLCGQGVYLDVDCPKCFVRTTHDVPARQAGRTDYPVECPECHAKFELWLDPQWFMMP